MRLLSNLLLICGLALPLAAVEIQIESAYLHLPMAKAGESRMVQLLDAGEMVRYFEVALPRQKSEALFWSTTDVSAWKGKSLEVVADNPQYARDLVALAEQSDAVRRPQNVYKERYRPQFHFTPMVGWTNDPNGLVYCEGEYHLFFQHNPYYTKWGNMTWGHAVSKDLLHWEEIGDALLADDLGTMYSGSAVVDHSNTAGFGAGAMLAFYTAAGEHAPVKVPYTQAMAYSTDRGRSFTKYESNPVVGFMEGSNRDPKVFWHEASGQWVMVLYLSRGKFILMGSKNLKDWKKLSDLPFPGGHECPELFELPVDGDKGNTRWVMWEGAGRYMLGQFDGTRFTAESAVLPSEWGVDSYAGQTYNDVPDGRRILLTWMNAGNGFDEIYPEMPFNQQMSIPRELTLHSTPQGVRLFAKPIQGVEKLYKKTHSGDGLTMAAADSKLSAVDGELLDAAVTMQAGGARSVVLSVRGTAIEWSPAAGTLKCMGKSVKLEGVGDELDLRVIADRTSLEIFAAGGRYVMSFCFRPAPKRRSLTVRADGGAARVAKLAVHELQSIW
jgi:fructan beta-fructosidase